MTDKTKGRLRLFGVVLFIAYLIVLMYFLLFAEMLGRTEITEGYSYNLTLFKEIRRFWEYRDQLGSAAVVLNLAGNVLAFVPFGFILPILFRVNRKWYIILQWSFIVSLSFEVTQLLTKVGIFDVDDLLLNTLGGLLGYWCFSLVNWIRRKVDGTGETSPGK